MKIKKYATVTRDAVVIVYAASKKEAAGKLGVKVKDVYLYTW